MALSVATSLAIEASRLNGSPRSRSRAACRVIARAAWVLASMSARMKASPWWSMIRLPKVSRSCAYATAASSAPWARPVATAAMPSRPESSAEKAILSPSPSSPIIRSAGIRTSSKFMAVVVEPVSPIFFSGGLAERPVASAGTMKHEIPLRPSPVRAMTL